jgi:hypothetical protein
MLGSGKPNEEVLSMWYIDRKKKCMWYIATLHQSHWPVAGTMGDERVHTFKIMCHAIL